MGKAAHIVGGEMSYECLGNNNYRITLLVYKDGVGAPAPGNNVADFDDPATITVYRGANPVLFNNDDYFLQSRNEVPLNITNPCLIPPDIEVERAVYTFDVFLPYDPGGYTIAYQRCCRNATITNIYTPGDVGATYSIFISNFAQQQKPDGSCGNSSPVFNDFPPIVICTNDPVFFDHSATDVDGDDLVYEFCTPDVGGGLGGTPGAPGLSTDCDGVAPDPACPPPFGMVQYIEPTYTTENPLGAGSPIPVTIDPVTGLIDGIPTIPGQFVVGVCVHEFRNGILLSTTRRDFQFNVEACEYLVVADVLEDSLINDPQLGIQEYIIISCGDSVVNFINQSELFSQPGIIDSYLWEFQTDAGVISSTEENPTITFPGYGTYQGVLIVNPDGQNCASDTADIFIRTFPEAFSIFDLVYDSCEVGPIQLFDQSYSGSDIISRYIWSYGNGIQDTFLTGQQPPLWEYQFPESGTFNVNLEVRDINGCEDESSETLSWFPSPIISIQPSSFRICEPGIVTFENNSYPQNGYITEWNLGDGSFSFEASPTHEYGETGVYSLSIFIESPTGCIATDTFVNWIEVLPNPQAGFSFTPETPSYFQPTVSFIDESIDAITWNWNFGPSITTNQPEPTYTFPDTGFFEVQQVVTHLNGCSDTARAIIDIAPAFTYHLPNAFTPNGDGINDTYAGKGIFYGITEFEFTIWNRWGELIYLTDDPFEGWNGRKNNVGDYVKNGVYVCLVRLKGARGVMVEYKSFATLIR